MNCRGNRLIILFTMGLLMVCQTFAAEVRMSIEPELISLLDRAVLKIEFIGTKGDAVEFPEIEGLKIEYGGQQSQHQFVNGRSSSSFTHTYVVTPSRVGDYNIGPVTVKYKGGEKELSAKLRVIKPKNDPQAQAISEMMFTRISTDRESPFVHDPFNLKVKIYVRDDIAMDGRFNLRGGMPESGIDGEFNWDTLKPSREELNGRIFNVYTLSTEVRTLTSGRFTFQPQIQLNIIIPRQDRRSYGFEDPFFGDLFGRQESRPYVLDCNRLEVKVRPIPMEGRPASFTGGVGILDFNVDLGPTQLKAGEPVTVRMKITGTGNLEKITPPSITDSHDIKLYDVRTIPSENPNEVRFEQVIIPTSDTVKEIPAILFSYFNTRTSDFRTISRGPFPIEVEASEQQAAQVIATIPSTVPQETEVLGHDIAYLKSAPSHWRRHGDEAWHQDALNRILLILPAAVLAITAFITTRRNRLSENIALARRQKAPKAARNHIRSAERALAKQDEAAFNQAIWDALTDYFGHRLNLAPGQVSLETILGYIPAERESLEHLFSTIEQRRYGIQPEKAASKEEMKQLLNHFLMTLKTCERMKI